VLREEGAEHAKNFHVQCGLEDSDVRIVASGSSRRKANNQQRLNCSRPLPNGNRSNGAHAEQDGQIRCGYVALIGRPNVGKSTLLNRFLGQKLSIVTAKPQTTRQQIAGIKTTQSGQVVYLDTPGIHLAARRALNRYMNRIARAALSGVDVVLFLVEAERWTKQDENVARVLEDVAARLSSGQ
jgi:small GTP-binding protein